MDQVELVLGAPVVERGHHDEVDHDAGQHPDRGRQQPVDELRLLRGAAQRQQEQGGRRDRHPLEPQRGEPGDQQPDQHPDPQRERAVAPQLEDGVREQHAEEGRHHRLAAAQHRAVDRGVHGQQRHPGRQERLLEVEPRVGQHPGHDRGDGGLDDLQQVGVHRRLAQPAQGRAHGRAEVGTLHGVPRLRRAGRGGARGRGGSRGRCPTAAPGCGCRRRSCGRASGCRS